MLLPFQWSVLSLEEAQLLMKYIETSTAIEGLMRNYEGMQKVGVLEIYRKLREFVEFADHYEEKVRYCEG